jgi:hypothetical protein
VPRVEAAVASPKHEFTIQQAHRLGFIAQFGNSRDNMPIVQQNGIVNHRSRDGISAQASLKRQNIAWSPRNSRAGLLHFLIPSNLYFE